MTTTKMRFCLQAVKTLNAHDLDTLTDKIGAYMHAGMAAAEAETAAVHDVLTDLAGERNDLVGLLHNQHADLFVHQPEKTRAGTGVVGHVQNPDNAINPLTAEDRAELTDGPASTQWLIDNAADPTHRAIAQRLKGFIGENVTMKFVNPGDAVPSAIGRRFNDSAAAVAELKNDGTYKIWMHTGKALNQTILLHELVHAATMKAFQGTTNALLRADMQNTLAAVKKSFSAVENTLGVDINDREKAAFFTRVLEDEDELLAYAFSSPTMRTWMQNMNADGKFISRAKSEKVLRGQAEAAAGAAPAQLTLWQKFVDTVRQLLRIGKRYQPQLEQAMSERQQGIDNYVQKGLDTKLYDKLDGYLEQAMQAQARQTGASQERLVAGSEKADQTDTKAFKKWFGDSKVVDAEGKPLVVYHGTAEKFDAFAHDKIKGVSEGVGFYFTASEKVAAGYGDTKQVYLAIDKPLDYNDKAFSKGISKKILNRAAQLQSEATGAPVSDGFLSNYGDVASDGLPRVLSEAADSLANNETAIDQIGELFNSGVPAETVLNAVRDVTGHDGIFSDGFSGEGDAENKIYVAWFPNQIKSATNNSGAFDAKNPDIRADFSGERPADAEAIEAGPVPDGTAEALAKVETAMRGTEAFKNLSLTPLPDVLKPGPNASQLQKERYAAQQLAEKVFGTKLAYFSSNIDRFANGLAPRGNGNLVFLNEATRQPVMAVLGHELTHAMRTTNPALYDALTTRLASMLREPGAYRDMLNDRYRGRGLPELSADKAHEELVADIVGDFFTDPKFWRDMTTGQPALFQRVLKAVRDFLDKVLAKLKNERPYGTDLFLTNLQAARDAVASTLSDYAKAKTAEPAAKEPAAKTEAKPVAKETAEEAALSATNEPFYSELSRQVSVTPMKSAPAAGWKEWLKGLTSKGMKADEIAWTGIEDWLDLQPGKVTREQVMEYLKDNGVQVNETMLGGNPLEQHFSALAPAMKWLTENSPHKTEAALREAYGYADDADYLALANDKWAEENVSFAKYHQYTLPGGKGYRELLLKLPEVEPSNLGQIAQSMYGRAFSELGDDEANKVVTSERKQKARLNYKSNHWNQPNVLAHVRFNERTDAEGKKVLFIEEIQSDWAQEGKKNGFQGDLIPQKTTWQAVDTLDRFDTPAAAQNWIERNPPPNPGQNMEARLVVREVPEGGYDVIEEQRSTVAQAPSLAGPPRAPFVGKTDAWVGLAIKRMIKYAADNGFDRVAFVNGEQSAERYDLSKHISHIDYEKGDSGGYEIIAHGMDGNVVLHEGESEEGVPIGRIEELVGKEVAKKISDGSGDARPGGYRSWRRLSELDLKVGGEGMKAFYDQIVPKVAKDVVRKLGGGGLTKFSMQVGKDFVTRSRAEAERDGGSFGRTEIPLMGDQLGFDITPSMQEKAAGGLPMFSLPNYTPEQRAALERAGINTRSRLQRAGDRIRKHYDTATSVLRSDLGKQFQQGYLDKFTGIANAVERDVGNLPIEQNPYIAARLANGGASSVMRGLLLHGQARWAENGQHLEKIPETKGLLDILKPLGADLDSFFGWMIGQRAKRLMSEGRENNFTQENIDALLSLNKGKEAEFRAAALGYAAFKRSVLDVAEKAGLLDAEARKVWDMADYIPFYRKIDEKAAFTATGKKGLAGQSSGIRQLKGGEGALNDPMENILMNFSRLIDASLKNNALSKTIDALTAAGSDAVEKVGYDMASAVVPTDQVKKFLSNNGMPDMMIDLMPPETFKGMAKMWSITAPTDPDVIRVMKDGKPTFYKVNDPLLLKAATSFVPFDFPGLGVARAFKRILTATVTATPDFMARNFVRDSMAVQLVGRDGFHPGKSMSGIFQSFRETGAAEDMLFAGSSFQSGQVNASDPTGTAVAMRRALRKRGFSASSANEFMSSIVDTPAKFWEAYRHVGEAIENANREAVYDATLKAGKGKTAAAYEAKDIMDFTLRGSSPIYQVMADVLPFFNARVQGLYRLGRADPRRLASYGTLMMMAALALGWANNGNPEFEELPDWQKDTFWHFWVGGKHFRIPKPFELGVVFGTVPERIQRYIQGNDVGKKTASRVYANIRDQLAFDAVPQLLRPGLNAYMNKDTFRDAPIEGMADEGKLPSQRYSARTSPTAVAAVKAGNVKIPFSNDRVMDTLGMSPKKLEYLVGGYLGTAGLYALGAADMATRKIEGLPPGAAKRLDELPVVSSFYQQEPARSTVFESDLYNMRTDIDRVFKSMEALAREGQSQEALTMRDENVLKLGVRQAINSSAAKLSLLNKRRDAILADTKMTPTEKREEIDKVLVLKTKVARETMTNPIVKNAQ